MTCRCAARRRVRGAFGLLIRHGGLPEPSRVRDVRQPRGAGPAGGADRVAAIGGRFLRAGLLPLGEEKLPVDPGVHELPGERIPRVAFPQVFERVDPLLLEGPLPRVGPERLRPRVEPRAVPERPRDHSRQPVVPPREDSLEHGGLRGVELHLRVAVPPQRVPQQANPFLDLPAVDLALPLERGVRFRYEGGDAHRHGGALPVAARDCGDPARKRPDGPDVVRRLPGQADHEVELEGLPAVPEDPLGRLQDVVVRDLLVDRPAKPLRPRFRREREPRLAHLPDLPDRVLPQRVQAERGEGERYVRRGERLHRFRDEPVDAAVVGGGKRQEACLVVSRPGRLLLEVSQQGERVALPHRPIGVSGLAEAAPPRAPPGDLDAQAVMDHAHRRQDRRRQAGENG